MLGLVSLDKPALGQLVPFNEKINFTKAVHCLMTTFIHFEHRLKLVEACHKLEVAQGTEKCPRSYKHEEHIAHSHLSEDVPS